MIVNSTIDVKDQPVIIYIGISVHIFKKEGISEYLLEFFVLSPVLVHNNIGKRHIPAAFAVQLLQEFFDLFVRIVRVFLIAVDQLPHICPIRIKPSLPEPVWGVLVSSFVLKSHCQTYSRIHDLPSPLIVFSLHIRAVLKRTGNLCHPFSDQRSNTFTVLKQTAGPCLNLVKPLRLPAPPLIQALTVLGKCSILPGLPLIINCQSRFLCHLHLAFIRLFIRQIAFPHSQRILHLVE